MHQLVSGRAERPILLKPAAEATHSSREIRGIFGALGRLGYDVDALLALAGVTRADIEDPDRPIPGHVCTTVLAAACRQRLVKNLPLRLAAETPVGANPLLDYIVASSESVGEGLKRLARYLRLVNPFVNLEIREQDEPIRIVVHSAGNTFAAELTVSLSLIRMRGETAGNMRAEFVSLCHEPDDAREFERLLGCPVFTSASWTGWALSFEAFCLPLRRSDPLLRRWLEGKAAQLLATQPPRQDLAAEVCRLLAVNMAKGEMSIEFVARHLATTPRTLQRHLAAEGTSFDTLRNTVRKEAAAEFLADPTLSVGEVAYLLGFSEPAAFHRAFRRWYGTPPQVFRQLRSLPARATEAVLHSR